MLKLEKIVTLKRINNKKNDAVEIVCILEFFDWGKSLDEFIWEYGISRHTYYLWRKNWGGLEVIGLNRIKELEDENARLNSSMRT